MKHTLLLHFGIIGIFPRVATIRLQYGRQSVSPIFEATCVYTVLFSKFRDQHKTFLWNINSAYVYHQFG